MIYQSNCIIRLPWKQLCSTAFKGRLYGGHQRTPEDMIAPSALIHWHKASVEIGWPAVLSFPLPPRQELHACGFILGPRRPIPALHPGQPTLGSTVPWWETGLMSETQSERRKEGRGLHACSKQIWFVYRQRSPVYCPWSCQDSWAGCTFISQYVKKYSPNDILNIPNVNMNAPC